MTSVIKPEEGVVQAVDAGASAIGAQSAPNIDSILRLAREGKSARAIGEALGCSKDAVIGRVHRAGIRLGAVNGWDDRPPPPPMRERPSYQRRLEKRRKGIARGERHFKAKLTTEAVYAIREAMDALCARYGVGFSALAAVASRQVWKHLPDVRSEATIAAPGQGNGTNTEQS